MAGTNDTHPSGNRCDDTRLRDFNLDFTHFVSSLHTRLNPKKVIVISLFPRAYCKQTHQKGRRCYNSHPEDTDIQSLNLYLQKANAIIQGIIEGKRFASVSFLRLNELICRRGNWSNLFGGFLKPDGLHMSPQGDKWLDQQLYKYMIGEFCFQSEVTHTGISEFTVT